MADVKANGRDQVSVVLPRGLRSELERVAAAEHRTVSGQVRHIVAAALEPPGVVERAVYGADAVRSPVTGQMYEQGSGAHPPEVQDRLVRATEAAGVSRLGEAEARVIIEKE